MAIWMNVYTTTLPSTSSKGGAQIYDQFGFTSVSKQLYAGPVNVHRRKLSDLDENEAERPSGQGP
jgi:hypothetical protein